MPFFAEEVVPLLIIRSLRSPLKKIRRGDRDLARQLARAVNSIGQNVSEGERREGRDQRYHYLVAAGSAKEAQKCLQQAEAWGHVDAEDIAEAHKHLDRQLGLLWGLTHKKD